MNKINFIIKFNEVNKKQKKKLWDFLLDNDFEWDVLKGDENLIQEFYLKQALNEIREYAIKEKKFNDSQIAEYKTCIETNENGKFNDKEKENFEHCMTVNICINYKINDILQIIDKYMKERK